MKKLKKTNLRFEKEVITALTGNELENVKGGAVILTQAVGCILQKTEVKCIIVSANKTACNCNSVVNICITQTEYNSCRCVDM